MRSIFPEHDIIIFKDLTIKIPWHYINMGLLVYFVPSFVIFFVAVFLFFRQRRCILERAAECEVWGDPNNFVPLANVPEWVTLLQKLCHHYYMTSEYSLVQKSVH